MAKTLFQVYILLNKTQDLFIPDSFNQDKSDRINKSTIPVYYL